MSHVFSIHRFRALSPVVLSAVASMTSAALADWSSDAGANTLVCGAPGDSVQPKVVAAPDGGVFVSWFDNRTGGYDVYLQRFDALGNALWAADGIELADLSMSSTQDYGLSPDGAGGVVVAFLDDRFGGVKVTATRVDASGTQVWGSGGKQVSVGGSVNKPSVALSGDGRIIVGWSRDAVTELQRLELDGSAAWDAPIALASAGANMTLADLQPGDGTSVIASMVRATTFISPKVIRAQKVDASGALLWGDNHVSVFTAGSLQFGNFPRFLPDGAGGAIFAWYTTGPLQSWAQHVDASGAILWGTNGTSVTATATGRERTDPAVAYDAATQRAYVGWAERIANTSIYGAYAQAFDAAGARLWGDDGVALLTAKSNFGVRELEAQVFDGDPCFLFARDIAFANGTLFAARVNQAGSLVWNDGLVTVSSPRSGRSRVATTIAANGDSFVAIWQDTRDGGENLYGQALRSDGSLGAPELAVEGDIDGDGQVGPSDLALLLGAWGPAKPGAAADLDRDGMVGPSDLAILLGAWSA